MYTNLTKTQLGYVVLHGYGLQLKEGTYHVETAPRFGEKIAQGTLKYADFNPYESGFAVDHLSSTGYGLNRYADLADETPALGYYKVSDNVDPRWPGWVILSPAIRTDSLPWNEGAGDVPSAIVWFGWWNKGGTLTFTAVGGNVVFTANAGITSWTRLVQLGGTARVNAIGVVAGNLVVGYGEGRTAQYVDGGGAIHDVTNTTPAAIYVFALTVDHAAAYVAGGTAATNTTTIHSSLLDPTMFTITADVTCGTSDFPIVSLAPGGGIALLFVGKTDELGQVSNTATPQYQSLVPFDSQTTANNRVFRWYLGAGGDEQRGPTNLFFSRDIGLWNYQPSTQDSGVASNVSPWALDAINPLTAWGGFQAVQGTSRWLFATITSATDASNYVLARDSRTGAWHTLIHQASSGIGAALAYADNVNRLFWSGGGSSPGVYSAYLGPGSGFPPGNSSYTYASTGTIDLPDIDLGFPDEMKTWFSVHIVADGITAGQTIAVSYGLDGAPPTSPLGTVNNTNIVNGSASLLFFNIPNALVTQGKRLSLRLTLATTNTSLSPQLRAVVVHATLVTQLYRIWTFTAVLPGGSSQLLTQDSTNPYTILGQLWTDTASGAPVAFIDRWNDSWVVRVLSSGEDGLPNEVNSSFMAEVPIRLLQVPAS